MLNLGQLFEHFFAKKNGIADGKLGLPLFDGNQDLSYYLRQIKGKYEKKANELKHKWRNKEDKQLRDALAQTEISCGRARIDYENAKNEFENIKQEFQVISINFNKLNPIKIEKLSSYYWIILLGCVISEIPLNFFAFRSLLKDEPDLFSYIFSICIGGGILLAANKQGKELHDILDRMNIIMFAVLFFFASMVICAISYLRFQLNNEAAVAISFGVISMFLYVAAIVASYHAHPKLYPSSIKTAEERDRYINNIRETENNYLKQCKIYNNAKNCMDAAQNKQDICLENFEKNSKNFASIKANRISAHKDLLCQLTKLNSTIDELCQIYWKYNLRTRMAAPRSESKELIRNWQTSFKKEKLLIDISDVQELE